MGTDGGSMLVVTFEALHGLWLGTLRNPSTCLAPENSERLIAWKRRNAACCVPPGFQSEEPLTPPWLTKLMLAGGKSGIRRAREAVLPPTGTALADTFAEACAAVDAQLGSGVGDSLSSILGSHDDLADFLALMTHASLSGSADTFARALIESAPEVCDEEVWGVSPTRFLVALSQDFVKRVASRAGRAGNPLANWYQVLASQVLLDQSANLVDGMAQLRADLHPGNLAALSPGARGGSDSEGPPGDSGDALPVAPPRLAEETFELFAVPNLVGVERPDVQDRLLDACRGHRPVLIVSGLSGSGKTHAVSALAREASRDFLWYSPRRSASVDELLADLDAVVAFQTQSVRSRSVELFRLLRSQRLCLVVDDVADMDLGGLTQVTEVAGSYESDWPLLVLVTREAIAAPLQEELISRVGIDGLSADSAVALLSSWGIDMPTAHVERLFEVTDGLAIAVAIYAALIVEFGLDPAGLLEGDIPKNQRLNDWIRRLLTRVGQGAQDLLGVLAVLDEPFNASLARRITGQITDERDLEPFEALVHHFLVDMYTPYRWRVHTLVAGCVRARLGKGQRQLNHTILALDLLNGVELPSSRAATESEFWSRIRAVEHLIDAGEFRWAQRVLLGCTAFGKANAHYTAIIGPCDRIVRAYRNRNRWIDYHLGHCLLIVGRVPEADRVVSRIPNDVDGVLRLHAARLRAEVIRERGDSERAVRLLRSAYQNAKTQLGRSTREIRPLAQAAGALAGLETLTGNWDAAEKLLVEVRTLYPDDTEVGRAVTLVNEGLLWLAKSRAADAAACFEQAAPLFKQAGDRRGEAWALRHLGEALLLMKRPESRARGERVSRVALKFSEDISDASLSYSDYLKRLIESPGISLEFAELVRREQDRVTRESGTHNRTV